MRKWYNKRGGYVYLPRVPWIKRPTWYTQPPKTYDPYKPRPWHLPIPIDELPSTEKAEELLERARVKESISRKHRVKRITTVPLTPDQKKLLEISEPERSRKKQVQSPKAVRPTRNRRTTQIESPKQENNNIGEEMPRAKRKYRVRVPRAVYRGRISRTVLRRNLRPRRRMMKSTRVRPMGSGTTFSIYRERAKYRSFRRRVMTLSPRQQIVSTNGSRTEWSYSQQGRANFTVCNKPQMLDITNNISGFNDTTRLFLKNGTDEFMLSNQSNANAYIRIYHFWCRRDTDSNISTLMDRALADIALASGTTPTVDSYGTTPFMASSTVAPFFKFIKSYYIELGAGRSHRHFCKYSWNKEWNQQIYTESLGSTVAGTQSKLAGWTKVVFMLMHGEPVNDVNDKTKVVPSSGAVDIVRKLTLNYYYGQPTNPTLEYVTSFVTTGVTENIMEADTDQASVVEKA